MLKKIIILSCGIVSVATCASEAYKAEAELLRPAAIETTTPAVHKHELEGIEDGSKSLLAMHRARINKREAKRQHRKQKKTRDLERRQAHKEKYDY